MKIRSGFVSNSSSSSFIVGFDKQIKRMTKENFKKLMFKDEDNIWDILRDSRIETNEAAEYLQSSFTSILEKNVYKKIGQGYISDMHNPDWFNMVNHHPDLMKAREILLKRYNVKNVYEVDTIKLNQDKDYKKYLKTEKRLQKEYEKVWAKTAKEYWNKYKDKFKDKKLYIISLEDQGRFAVLENGEFLAGFPHITISFH